MGFLEEWEKEVASNTYLDTKEKAKMCLSKETLEGIKITGLCKILLRDMIASIGEGTNTLYNLSQLL